MTSNGFFTKVKKFVFKDDTSDLSEEQKLQLEGALKDRKFELIAQKRFRDLERKFESKTKKNFSERLLELKKYRENNIRKQAERGQHLRSRRDIHESKVAQNKLREQRVKTGQLKTADIVRARLRGDKL